MAVGLWPAAESLARDFRVAQIPNGSVFSCSNCHISAGGGGTRNGFGNRVFQLVGFGSQSFWSASLAAEDSDGDGFTNGTELGDPDGDFQNLGPTSSVSNPGNSSSRPSNSPPTFTSSPVPTATIGTFYQYNATATDPNGNSITFSKVAGPSWLSVASNGTASGTPTSGSNGSFTVTIRATDNGSPTASTDQTYTLTVLKVNQTITFNALANKTFGDPPFTVSATASSGLTVSFSILSGPATLSGSTVTITGAGTVTVRASQSGNGTYNAAPNVDRSFTVAKASQIITFNALAGKTFGDAPFTVSASASSGLAVSFSIASGPATVSGSTVTITGAGIVTVRASQGGNGNYNAATPVDQSFTVAKANQTITFNALANKTFGDAPFTVSASASSGLTVSFSILSGSATVSGSTVTITGAGTVTVRASQTGNANYNAATPVDRSFTVNKATPVITWSNPADIVFGTVLAGTQLNATANVPGSFAYTPVAGAVLNAGNGQTLSVSFTPTDTANYNAASKDVFINVLKANQTITFNTLANKTYGDPPFTVSATASSGLAVSFSVVSGPATISGDTVTLTGLGTVTVRASQSGNGNYNAAADVDRSFTVTADAPAITAHPQTQLVIAGTNVTLSVVATGTAPLAYQWRFNGDDLPNETGASLTLNNITLGQSGEYSVMVTNVAGTATGGPATLTVASSILTTTTTPTAEEIRTSGFPVSLLLEVGRSYRVQVSTNLVRWTDLTNFTSSGAAFEFVDSSATNRTRSFYRVVSP
ncbi:MAG: immunoglobulin domain-containing protein [Verrucomicrobiota bacterium]